MDSSRSASRRLKRKKEESESIKNEDDEESQPNSVQKIYITSPIANTPASSKEDENSDCDLVQKCNTSRKKKNTSASRIRQKEKNRQKRALESPGEKEARLKKEREYRRKQIASLSQEEIMKKRLTDAERVRKIRANQTEEKKEEQRRKQRELNKYFQQKRKANETEAEKEERLRRSRANVYFAWEAKKASLTPEEVEHAEFQLKMKNYLKYVAWKAKFTPEEWEEKKKQKSEAKHMRLISLLPDERRKKAEKDRAYVESIPLEKKRENYRKAAKKVTKKLQQDPVKRKEYNERKKKYQREKRAKETPEERHKRQLRCKIWNAKRKAKIEMEKEGGLTKVEMERRLEEVKREVEEKDRLKRETKPLNKSKNKPQKKGRKPKKKKTTKKSKKEVQKVEDCPSPSPLQQEPPQQEEQFLEENSQPIPPPVSPHSETFSEEEYHCAYNEPDDDDYHDDVKDEIKPENPPEEYDGQAQANPTSQPYTPSCDYSEADQEQKQIQPPLNIKTVEEKRSTTEVEISPHSLREENNSVGLEKRAVLICEECGTCLYPRSMKLHNHLFHNPSKISSYKCPKCNKEFATPRSLWNHYLNLHGEEKNVLPKEPCDSSAVSSSSRGGPFICEQCGKEYKHKADCEAHVKRVHLEQRIFCEVCGKEEQTQGKLWRHKIAKHPELDTPPPKGMIICQYCSEPVLRSLPQHVKKVHPDQYQEFISNSSPKKKQTRKRIKCVECDKEFRMDDLKRHMRNIHGQGSNAIPCQHCGKKFKDRLQLTEHMSRVKAIESFDRKVDAMKLISEKKDEDGSTLLFCSLCDEKLFSRNEMRGHLLSTHLEVFEKLSKENDDGLSPSWKCVECLEGPCFDTEQLFYSHVKSSHPEKTSYCSQLNCQKLFRNRVSLRAHHGEEHPHAKFRNPLCFENATYRRPRHCCASCPESFLTKSELREHVKTLHPEAYWPCPHCQLLFYTEEQLADKHLAICRRNPDTRRPKKVAIKGGGKGRKKLQKETSDKDETASEPFDCGKKKEAVRTKPSQASRIRSSSRSNANTKTVKLGVKVELNNFILDDHKLEKDVKVMLVRLTKQQLEYYGCGSE
ncbi:unnamed protein product [Orchesella dallaii]|uniref:C2H2-type domain-containing protein n=1 Tax=Orchesella dallaii TaxID=48710 RepID=A0ABP1S4H6_9HEXA